MDPSAAAEDLPDLRVYPWGYLSGRVEGPDLGAGPGRAKTTLVDQCLGRGPDSAGAAIASDSDWRLGGEVPQVQVVM